MVIAARSKTISLLMCIAWVGVAVGAEQMSVDASRQGTAVAIKARATIKAPCALIWQTLTDYNHLSEFIPGMMTSHVIERHGSAAIVKQTGEARFWFFTYPIEVVVESREEPLGFIGMRVLKGNLKQLDGGYRIEKTDDKDDKYVLRWSGIIEVPASLPLFMTMPLMRANISEQFRAMVKEIERREVLRTGEYKGTCPLIT
jgi:ribosome-associated toxin RatA of RatAB toxin-antitoxin module